MIRVRRVGRYAWCWMWTSWQIDFLSWTDAGWLISVGPLRVSYHPGDLA